MKFIERHPMILMVLSVCGTSASAIIVRYSSAPSITTAFYRLAWTVLLLTPAVFAKSEYRKELRTTDKRLFCLSALSGVFLAIHFVTWFDSLRYTSVASSTAIVCTEVIWVALGFALFLKGRIPKLAVLSIAITLFGSILIALSDYGSTAENALLGDFLALFSAIVVAMYTLIGQIARRKMTTTAYTYIVYTFCLLSLSITVLITDTSLTGHGISPVICGLLLSVFSTLMGHSLFSWCLKYFSPSFVSACKLCEPVVAAVFAVILFSEIPVLMQVIGGIITIGGVLLYSRVENQQTT